MDWRLLAELLAIGLVAGLFSFIVVTALDFFWLTLAALIQYLFKVRRF